MENCGYKQEYDITSNNNLFKRECEKIIESVKKFIVSASIELEA